MRRFLAPFAALAFAACASSGGSSGGSSTTPTAQNETGTQQAERGAKLYGEHCAKCHGDSGQGTDKGPAVVGVANGALPLDPPPNAKYRKVQFHTAKDIALWVKDNMPADKPGSLTIPQYFDILAFDLKANGVDVSQKPVNLDTAESFVIHP